MASIRSRKRNDGTVATSVTWRLGGLRDGAQQSETFDRPREARDFKLAVEAAGNQWPDGWIPGFGYARQEPTLDEPPALHTFREWGLGYVEQLTGIGPDTRQRYARQVGRLDDWLAVGVGGVALVETLTDTDVRRWVNQREADGAAPKTIGNYHGLLFGIMGFAVGKGLRADNPCAETKLPRVDKDADTDDEMVFLTEDEFRLVLEAVHQDSKDLLLVAVGTGLRWGELSALQVRDLVLDGPTPQLTVRRAWKKNGTGEFARADLGRFYLGRPKTKKSRRRLTLSPLVVESLRRAIGDRRGEQFVFTAPLGGPLDQRCFYERRWQRAVRAARDRGLNKTPRFHDLRHSHAAWLISAGVPLPVIQQRLGHESITTTVDRYGGLLVQAHDAADLAIDAALLGGRVPHLRSVSDAESRRRGKALDQRQPARPGPEAARGSSA